MTTLAQMVERTNDILYGGARQSFTTLASDVDSIEGSVTVSTVSNIAEGSFLAIDDELMYVLAWNSSSKVATVQRSMRATTAASHTSGSLVEVNPVFPQFRVKQALQDEINSWPNDVYQVDSVDLDTVSGTAGYDLDGVPSNFLGILDVQLGPRTAITDGAVSRLNFELIRDADTTIYASGAGIVLPGGAQSVRDLRVVFAKPFVTTPWIDSTVMESGVGLASTMLDIPPMGAAARLMVGRDIKRSMGEGQGEPRRAEEIPAGFAGSISTYLRREVQRRLGEEASRLRASYPIRRV